MEAICSFEMSFDVQRTTRYYTLEDRSLQCYFLFPGFQQHSQLIVVSQISLSRLFSPCHENVHMRHASLLAHNCLNTFHHTSTIDAIETPATFTSTVASGHLYSSAAQAHRDNEIGGK
jgi:hypothetical protein